MTLEELEMLPREILVPKDVAPILKCDPYAINVACRNGKNPFPFPVIRIGSRIKIPKRPFIKAMRGDTVEGGDRDAL